MKPAPRCGHSWGRCRPGDRLADVPGRPYYTLVMTERQRELLRTLLANNLMAIDDDMSMAAKDGYHFTDETMRDVRAERLVTVALLDKLAEATKTSAKPKG